MNTSVPLVLMGFPEFEHTSMATLFRLAGHRGSGYTVVDELAQAQVIIANADDKATMLRLRGQALPQKIVLVGRNDGGTGWPLQPRPIKLMALLHALDQVLGRGAAAPPPPAPPDFEATRPFFAGRAPHAAAEPPDFQATQPFFAPKAGRGSSEPVDFQATQPFMPVDPPHVVEARQQRVNALSRGFEATQPFSLDDLQQAAPAPRAAPRTYKSADTAIDADAISRWRAAQPPTGLEQPVAEPAPARPPAFETSTNMIGLSTQALPPLPGPPKGEVLLVDDNDASRRSLQKMLQMEGYRSDMVRTYEDAVDQVLRRPYRVVLLDDGGNAYQAIRGLRAKKPAEGKRAAVVVMSNRGGTFDKLRAKLAGCDAYLVKPVREEDLLRVLDKHGR